MSAPLDAGAEGATGYAGATGEGFIIGTIGFPIPGNI